MENNEEKLKIDVDFSRGYYYITGENFIRCKYPICSEHEVSGRLIHSFSKKRLDYSKEKIMDMYDISEEEYSNIDPVLYEALALFDDYNHSEFSDKYIERAKQKKELGKEFNITYYTEISNYANNMSFLEIIRADRIINKQKKLFNSKVYDGKKEDEILKEKKKSQRYSRKVKDNQPKLKELQQKAREKFRKGFLKGTIWAAAFSGSLAILSAIGGNSAHTYNAKETVQIVKDMSEQIVVNKPENISIKETLDIREEGKNEIKNVNVNNVNKALDNLDNIEEKESKEKIETREIEETLRSIDEAETKIDNALNKIESLEAQIEKTLERIGKAQIEKIDVEETLDSIEDFEVEDEKEIESIDVEETLDSIEDFEVEDEKEIESIDVEETLDSIEDVEVEDEEEIGSIDVEETLDSIEDFEVEDEEEIGSIDIEETLDSIEDVEVEDEEKIGSINVEETVSSLEDEVEEFISNTKLLDTTNTINPTDDYTEGTYYASTEYNPNTTGNIQYLPNKEIYVSSILLHFSDGLTININSNSPDINLSFKELKEKYPSITDADFHICCVNNKENKDDDTQLGWMDSNGFHSLVENHIENQHNNEDIDR